MSSTPAKTYAPSYKNMLSAHYYTVSFKYLPLVRVEWIMHNWKFEINAAVAERTPTGRFLYEHRMKLKLVQPPEEAL